MSAQTKRFALLHDWNYGMKEMIEVQDERDAVEKAGSGASRLVLCEQTVMDHQGETLKGELKNHAPYIYLNVDRMVSRDEVIAKHKAELEKANGLEDEFSRKASVTSLQNVIDFFERRPPSARFITEGRGD